LVLNAVQAMKKAGTLAVRTGSDHAAGRGSCWIEVTDTGPGIAPEILGQLFEPYVTNKEGGTGLGLAIARKVIESHRGEITARNLDDGGACFRATLPVTRRQTAARDTHPDEVTTGR
ncbi:MAG TPA: ATP-binding protein, partial [Planctomycetota bacterium]|nr:ATP-binding protein [Planctomycetota bacterium]